MKNLKKKNRKKSEIKLNNNKNTRSQNQSSWSEVKNGAGTQFVCYGLLRVQQQQQLQLQLLKTTGAV